MLVAQNSLGPVCPVPLTVRGNRPTHSVYGSTWFDVLCLAANYHCEHHDFPKVPLWNLPELKRLAGAEFYPASPSWRAVLRGAFSSKITYPRWERV